jgi:serine/threonine-protein kinase
MYLALEPYVRRYTPEILVSWVRLINGQFRDPKVGRDVLVGLAFAILAHAFVVFAVSLPELAGNPPAPPLSTDTAMLQDAPLAISRVLDRVRFAFQDTMLLTLVFVGFHALTRRLWAAFLLTLAFFAIVIAREEQMSLGLTLLFSTISASFGVIALARFGVLTTTTATFATGLLRHSPLTLNASRIYASTGFWVLGLLAAIAAASYYAARGNEPLFRRVNSG